jgi:hypothetical protein
MPFAVCRREQLAEAMQSLQPLTQYPLWMYCSPLMVCPSLEIAFTATGRNLRLGLSLLGEKKYDRTITIGACG